MTCNAKIVDKPRSWPTSQCLDQWRCDTNEHEHLFPERSWTRVARWRHTISWTQYALGIAWQLCVCTTSDWFSKSARQLLQNTHTHTHNYTARWQAGRSGSTTLLRNRIKLSAFHSYAALYCMHWISPLFTNASKLRKRRVGKDWKCWAETCRAKPHVVAEHACTKGRITYRSIHAYNFSSTFFGCEWKASSCWILYILYSTSNKANIHMHAHGTMSFLPILSLAS